MVAVLWYSLQTGKLIASSSLRLLSSFSAYWRKQLYKRPRSIGSLFASTQAIVASSLKGYELHPLPHVGKPRRCKVTSIQDGRFEKHKRFLDSFNSYPKPLYRLCVASRLSSTWDYSIWMTWILHGYQKSCPGYQISSNYVSDYWTSIKTADTRGWSAKHVSDLSTSR
jgi:hypothetical protein